ncbi:putative amino-acid transport system substrate-binding protein|uniref:Amino acid ABC transporter substrate-binding protein (PAAT family) n=1 Tax=Brenneria salicis ATCC 15712 = DSM 30166 TaxID=714314 RepID=A0A366I7K5_9GAMM|nr:transporter substrate-binding domain-containing protein [Brenneria salicis]NMN90153.1 putative amino-acid transport system substrate-binding protein [Brenneria salicis ATCC 15712 = DSM 30166]RBP63226.1 amino acid ABC transporter substrate-binding protein (PAAT family) [Brenneria salicis ATCC 15712 = DSM 30166]RLM30877.1 ABC transporter substrate-binding protein [Brenneria salicis ATCC 15712 = DSM 30166]
MKKTFSPGLKTILLTIVIAVALTGCDNQASTDQDNTLRIGTTGQSFPGSYKENNKLVGYDVDVAEAIAKELGYKIQWTTADFSGLLGQLEAGKLDTIANNFVNTTERQKKYNFSDAYLTYASQIVTSVKNENIQSIADLKGKTISGVLGSTHVANLRNAFPDNSVTIRTYETRDAAVNDVVNNRVQGYVNSRPILLAEINKHQLPLKLVGEPLSNEQVSFPFAKTPEGEKLLAGFNEKLNVLRQNGQLKILAEKYFGSDQVLAN